MAQERFVTENPFRILSVGANTAFSTLRRRADGAGRAASAGLIEAAPFDEAFGAADLAEFSSSVRSLDRDPERRTIFRILWPLNAAAIPAFVEGGDLDPDDFPPEEIAQFRFLREWYAYLRERNAADASMALANWAALRKHEAFAMRLQNLLAQEDELSPAQASDIVSRAEAALERYVLESLAIDASRRWEAGESAKGSELTRVIFDSCLDEHLKALALEPLAELGQRLDARLRQMLDELPEWHMELAIETPREATRLRWLGQCLANRVPLASGWKDAEKEWNASVCDRMVAKIVELHEADRNQEALRIAEWSYGYAKDPERKARFEHDVIGLRELIQRERFSRDLEQIIPIRSSPPLFGINGCGARLYGNSPFPPDPTRYFSILYLTIAFIPIIPLRRYLVQGSKNGYYFHGKTRWTPFMIGHFAVACALIGWLVYGTNHLNDPLPSPYGAHSSPYSNPSYYPPPDAASEDGASSYVRSSYSQPPSEEDERRKRLQDEQDGLVPEIEALTKEVKDGSQKLEVQYKDLGRRKKDLEARRDHVASMADAAAFDREVEKWNRDLRESNALQKHLTAQAKIHDKKADRYKQIEKALE